MNSHGTIKLFDLATRTICTSDATSNEITLRKYISCVSETVVCLAEFEKSI